MTNHSQDNWSLVLLFPIATDSISPILHLHVVPFYLKGYVVSWSSATQTEIHMQPNGCQDISAQLCCCPLFASLKGRQRKPALAVFQEAHANTVSPPRNLKLGKRGYLGNHGFSCLPIKCISSNEERQWDQERKKMLIIAYHSSREDNNDPNFRKKHLLSGSKTWEKGRNGKREEFQKDL